MGGFHFQADHFGLLLPQAHLLSEFSILAGLIAWLLANTAAPWPLLYACLLEHPFMFSLSFRYLPGFKAQISFLHEGFSAAALSSERH